MQENSLGNMPTYRIDFEIGLYPIGAVALREVLNLHSQS